MVGIVALEGELRIVLVGIVERGVAQDHHRAVAGDDGETALHLTVAALAVLGERDRRRVFGLAVVVGFDETGAIQDRGTRHAPVDLPPLIVDEDPSACIGLPPGGFGLVRGLGDDGCGACVDRGLQLVERAHVLARPADDRVAQRDRPELS